MKLNFSLKIKLTLSILLVILFFGILATSFVFLYSRNNLVENEKQGLILRAQGNALVLEREFNHSIELSEALVESVLVKDYLSQKNPKEQDTVILEELKDFNIEEVYLAVYLMNKDGKTLVSTDESFVGQNYSFRDYFKQAVKGKSWVDVAFGVTSGELGYYFSNPVINDEGAIVGVAVLKMQPDFINQVILLVQERGEQIDKKIYLFDEFGVILHSGVGENVLNSIGDLDQSVLRKIEDKKRFPTEGIASAGYDGVFEEILSVEETEAVSFFDEIKNEERILVIEKLKDLPFYLMFDESADIFSETALIFSFYLGIFVLGAAVLAFIFIFLFVGGFLRPLKRLNETVKKTTKGDLSQRFEVKTTDEISDLGNNFNKLTISLQKSLTNVEKQVEDRTKKLENLNKLMVGRELKIREMKDKIKELENKKFKEK